MITIKNEILSCEIKQNGAEIKSLKKGETEYIWCSDPKFWGKSAPVLFPCIGSSKDDKYTLNGKTYPMKKHGFLIDADFTVEERTDSSVTLLYTHNEKTLEVYPYEFEFRAVFTLVGSSLKVEYRVNNLTDDTMYFSVGAHEAYATPGGVEEYDIMFPYKEDLDAILLDGPLVIDETKTFAKKVDCFSIYEKYFELDTLIFRKLKSKEVTLRNRLTDRTVKVEYPDCDYIAFWHEPGSKFLCIEPWTSLTANANGDYDITKKEGIVSLAPNGVYSNTHIITV
ncbi:MAG: aldose 1-epimerase family protein [Ruminococcaceae bacterium]|nr:aldose 1-epimerase family protein [Oscillospiraceae bacterium]